MSKKEKSYKIDRLSKPNNDKKFEVFIQNYKRQIEESFKWTIVSEEYIPSNSCQTEPFTKFLEHTISSLNKLETRKWNDVLKKPHNHIVKQNQPLKSRQKIKNKLKQIGKDVEIYQIAGKSLEHRIFGYRENGVFHIMLNDLHHKETIC